VETATAIERWKQVFVDSHFIPLALRIVIWIRVFSDFLREVLAGRRHSRAFLLMSADFTSLKQAAVINSLRTRKIFTGPPSDDLQIVAGIANPRSLEKGEYLFREGDPSSVFTSFNEAPSTCIA